MGLLAAVTLVFLAVDCAIAQEETPSYNCTSKPLVSSICILAGKHTQGDRLVWNEKTKDPYKITKGMYSRIAKYDGPPDEVINFINVTNLLHPHKGQVTILQGGVDHTHVTVRMDSDRTGHVAFQTQIWAVRTETIK